MVLAVMSRLAAVGLLTWAIVATAGAAGTRYPAVSSVAKESKLLLQVQSRQSGQRTHFDRRGPGFRMPGVPGFEIPPVVVEKKPKIPAPKFKQCVAAQKVGTVVVTPMSQLPSPGICNGKQVAATTSVIGSYGKEPGIYPDSGAKHVTHNYCVTCKYDGDFVDPKKFSGLSFIYIDSLKKFPCLRCPAQHSWNAAKKKCCPN
jgi:hypothetical protein